MGGNVGALDLRQTPVPEFETVASRYGVKTAYAQTDVSSAESLQAGFDKVMQTLGTLDGIFTAAGIAIDKPFVEQTPDEFMNIQKVNVSLVKFTRMQQLTYGSSRSSERSSQLNWLSNRCRSKELLAAWYLLLPS